jgi:hypothetical protein
MLLAPLLKLGYRPSAEQGRSTSLCRGWGVVVWGGGGGQGTAYPKTGSTPWALVAGCIVRNVRKHITEQQNRSCYISSHHTMVGSLMPSNHGIFLYLLRREYIDNKFVTARLTVFIGVFKFHFWIGRCMYTNEKKSTTETAVREKLLHSNPILSHLSC